MVIREKCELLSSDLGWLILTDHFISTVGPYSGQGEALQDLLVLADAHLTPRTSFPMHPHRDMEILTWVAEGTLHHKDNRGSNQLVSEGSLQLMSARDGIFHAEGNSSDNPLRIFQIWINPSHQGGTPVVEAATLQGVGFEMLAGPANAPLIIRQNVWLYAAKLAGERVQFEIPEGNFAYGISIGDLNWNGQKIGDGSGLRFDRSTISVEGKGQALLILQNETHAPAHRA